MSHTLTCVRHGQGYHNVGTQYHHLIDPSLTDVGKEQCRSVGEKCTRFGADISLIVASPLTRTLQTALTAFDSLLPSNDGPNDILALPSAQETFDYPFNTGSSIDVLQEKCTSNHWPVDLSLVEDGWTDKTLQSRYYPASCRVEARARDTRQFLRTKFQELVSAGVKNPHIVLVTHGSFLHYLTTDYEDCTKHVGTGWDNCECRAYTFEDGVESDDLDAYLVEKVESRQKRGATDSSSSREEQLELFQKAVAVWEKQGLPNALDLGANLSTA